MNKHYILNLNPHAQHSWDRCTLRNPITGDRPDLASLIAEAVGKEGGSYLVSVNIEIKVLEQAPLPSLERVPVEIPSVRPTPQLQELVA
jgi:hypothetical protein